MFIYCSFLNLSEAQNRAQNREYSFLFIKWIKKNYRKEVQ